MIPTLEWLPGLSDTTRRGLILVALTFALIGLVAIARGEQLREELVAENERLRRDLNETEPARFLQQVASTLFREGAWRLTVFRKSHSTSEDLGDHLVRLGSVASDPDQAALSAHTIAIRPETQFSSLFRSNLADPRYRRAEETGMPPTDVQSAEWHSWRQELFGSNAVIGDASTFRASKIAWYAAQDAQTQAVFAVIAESTEVEGIAVDVLAHNLTPSWLFFICQMAEVQRQAHRAT